MPLFKSNKNHNAASPTTYLDASRTSTIDRPLLREDTMSVLEQPLDCRQKDKSKTDLLPGQNLKYNMSQDEIMHDIYLRSMTNGSIPRILRL